MRLHRVLKQGKLEQVTGLLRRSAVWLSGSIVLFVIGCTSSFLPFTGMTEASARRWPGTTDADLHQGRSLYRDQCSGCHSLHSPVEYSAAVWDTLLPVMQRRAKTTDAERVLMFKYVMLHAKMPVDSL